MSLYKKIVRTMHVADSLSSIVNLRNKTSNVLRGNKVNDLSIEGGLLAVDTILASLEAKLTAEQESNAYSKQQVSESLTYLIKELDEYNKQLERELYVKYTQTIE